MPLISVSVGIIKGAMTLYAAHIIKLLPCTVSLGPHTKSLDLAHETKAYTYTTQTLGLHLGLPYHNSFLSSDC